MIAIDAVVEACRLMGVPFSVVDEYPPGVIQGPASGGCHPTLGVYMMRCDVDSARNYSCDVWAWTLHELAHVVWWHPRHGDDVCEEPLMAWEYGVARHFGIPGYWDCTYTRGTTIWADGEWREVGGWARPQRSAWFAKARRECVRRGALTPDFRPTWRRPIMRLDETDNGWNEI